MNVGQSADDREDESSGISDWMARVDEALRRGESPPSFEGEVPEGSDTIDPNQMRNLLEWMHHAPFLAEEGTTQAGDEGPATLSGLPGDDELVIPETIGRFRPEEVLGSGGFGIVFRAFDPEMDRLVALKIPKVDPLLSRDVRRRFLREARAAARLDHPNLVPVFEAGEAGAVCYIASAYCEGPTLRRWIDRGNAPLGSLASARMALAMARAIEYMHGRGILHCDLKPGNVLLDLPFESGADPIPRITDFGLARLAKSSPGDSSAAKPWGTPPYMAPEQIAQQHGAIGPHTDLYALGAMLYELLTGLPPHRARTLWELLHAVASEPPVRPRKHKWSIPRDLDAIVLKCLEKRPDRRYASAKELADDLERFLDHRPTLARPLGRIRRSARWAARNPTSTVVIVAGILASCLVVSYALVLARMNTDLARANDIARVALDRERRHLYVATLALAQQDGRLERIGPAQTQMDSLIPAPGSGEPDLRDFAWHYLHRQLRRHRTILDDLGPGYEVWLTVANGRLLGNNGQTLGIWELPSLADQARPGLGPDRPILRFQGDFPIPPLSDLGDMAALSPDGRLAAFVTGAGSVAIDLMVLDLDRGQGLGVFSWPEIQPLRWPHFSPDGTTLGLSVGPDRRPNSADLLERRQLVLDSGNSLIVLLVPGSPSRLAFSAEGDQLASIRLPTLPSGSYLDLWDVASGRRLATDSGAFTALAISPLKNGPIAVGTTEGMIQLREPDRGGLISEWFGREGPILCLAFSPDGRFLISGGDRVADLWEVNPARHLATLGDLGGLVNSAAFLPGASEIALGTSAGEVEIWHTESFDEAITFDDHTDEVWGVAFSPDGQWLASVAGDRSVVLRDARTGTHLKTLTGHEEWPSGLAFHPDGHRVITVDFGGDVRIWDIRSGQLASKISAHPDRIRALAISPDGSRLATGGRDAAIQIWDAADWTLQATLTNPHDGQVRGLAFSPDGRTLASVGDVTLIQWEVESWRTRSRWETPSDLTCLAYSPDGTMIALGDNRRGLTLRNAADGAIRAILSNLHREEISAVCFSPDGRVLAAAGQDGVIGLIDVETGLHHLALAGHEGGINALVFSPDGRTLASAGHDHTVRLWWAGHGPPLNLRGPDLR